MKEMKEMKENLLWKQNPELRRLIVLNPTDFNCPIITPAISKDFFPNSLGLADQNEIIARNEIVRFLFDNPKIGVELNNMYLDILHAPNGFTKLPTEGNDFLAFYEKENAYWQTIDSLVTKLKDKTNSVRLVNFIDQLESQKARLFNDELFMGKRISEALNRATRMEGFIEFETGSREVTNCVIMGQKSFNSRWSPTYKGHIPDWLDRGWLYRVTGIKALVQKISSEKLKKESYRSTLILNFPEELRGDIARGVERLIFKRRSELKDKNIRAGLTKKEKNELNFMDKISSLRVSAEFKYDDKGLVVRLLAIKMYADRGDDYVKASTNDYRGLTVKEGNQLKEKIDLFDKLLRDSLAAKKALSIVTFLEKNCDITFTKGYKINSDRTDEVFSWSFLDNIYALTDNKNISAELNQQRNFFWSGLSEIISINRVINDLKHTAKAKNLPICVPTVITDKVGINFKNLAPINMIGQNKEMVPFSFPELNGRMICLTGRHGRGKSVAGNSVLETIWLAQSGLPVFAEEFSFDVKDVIGAVINDEGNGSTATVFIQKTKNLLENIAKVPSEKSVIFIDEIGKGTQESSGLALGKRLLSTMADRHYSVIFNTQIMDLAKYAEQTVQAKCLKVDKNHQFSQGIGEGEMDELIKEIGLNKFLN